MLDDRAKGTVGQFRLIEDWSVTEGWRQTFWPCRESFQVRKTIVVHRKRRSTIHADGHTRDGWKSWLWATLTLTPFYVWGIRLRPTFRDYSSFYKKRAGELRETPAQ